MTHPEWLSRTELLFGKEKLAKLRDAHVLIVGLGGVGAYAAEMICRAGVGKLTIIDGDTINESNRNRQLPALISNIGKEKAAVMAERLKDINADLELRIINEYIHDHAMSDLLKGDKYDYVVDAIDTLAPKIYLILSAVEQGIPIVSSMGAGGKTDPTQIQVKDISKTYNCNLARALRKRLHKFGVRKGFKAVFSPETVAKESVVLTKNETNKKSNVGTISYMPPMFGCSCASVVINDLVNK